MSSARLRIPRVSRRGWLPVSADSSTFMKRSQRIRQSAGTESPAAENNILTSSVEAINLKTTISDNLTGCTHLLQSSRASATLPSGPRQTHRLMTTTKQNNDNVRNSTFTGINSFSSGNSSSNKKHDDHGSAICAKNNTND